MKCYQANSGAGMSGLALRDVEEPEACYRRVLVRVRANSLNFRELSILRGTYPLPVKADVVMCSDGAGEVIAVAKGLAAPGSATEWQPPCFPVGSTGQLAWEYTPKVGGSALARLHHDQGYIIS